jgi:hypothetical protein
MAILTPRGSRHSGSMNHETADPMFQISLPELAVPT